MNDLDKIWLYKGGYFIKDFKYSINDEVFYYNILTNGGDEKVYKYNRKQHHEIQYEKECEMFKDVKDNKYD